MKIDFKTLSHATFVAMLNQKQNQQAEEAREVNNK